LGVTLFPTVSGKKTGRIAIEISRKKTLPKGHSAVGVADGSNSAPVNWHRCLTDRDKICRGGRMNVAKTGCLDAAIAGHIYLSGGHLLAEGRFGEFPALGGVFVNLHDSGRVWVSTTA